VGKKKLKRKKLDWERIEVEYRAGILSIREIARRNGCSHQAISKHAKEEGWERDLTARVQLAIKQKLIDRTARQNNITGSLPKSLPEEERQLIDIAAEDISRVVVLHRTHARKARKTVELLLGQLVDAAEHRSEIEAEIDKETGGDHSTVRRDRMLRAVSLQSHSVISVNLANSFKTLVSIERQAYALDEKESEKKSPLGDILADLDIGGLPAI